MTVLPSRWTALASVVAGVLLASGASCAMRGTSERLGVEAAPGDQNTALWAAAARECWAAGRTWSQGQVDGVLVGRCSSVESLGLGPAIQRRLGPSPSNHSVATTKPQERAPEERVGSGQVDMESAAQGGAGADATVGARPLSMEGGR